MGISSPPSTHVALLWLAEMRMTLKLAWPMMISQIAYKSQLIGNVILMGWLGPKELAAGALAVSIINPVLLFSGGVLSAITPLVAQSLGSGALDGGRRYLRQSLWMSLFIAVLVLPLFLDIAPLLKWLGQPPELADRAAEFGRILGFMSFPSIGIIVFRNFFAAHGIPHVPVMVIVAGSLLNFMVGFLLIDRGYGLKAVAITTVCVNFAMIAFMVFYIIANKNFQKYQYFNNIFLFDFIISKNILMLGLPIGVTVLSEIALFSAVSLMMGRIGAVQLAGYTAAAQYVGVAFSVATGIGVAAMVRIGWAKGRRDAVAVSRAGWAAVVMTVIAMLISSSLYLMFPETLIRVFIDPANPQNAAVFSTAVFFMTMVAILQMADGIQGVSSHILRGMSDAVFPMVTAIIGYWAVGFVVGYYIGLDRGLGPVGVYAGLICGLASVALTLLLRFSFLSRRMLRNSARGAASPKN